MYKSFFSLSLLLFSLPVCASDIGDDVRRIMGGIETGAFTNNDISSGKSSFTLPPLAAPTTPLGWFQLVTGTVSFVGGAITVGKKIYDMTMTSNQIVSGGKEIVGGTKEVLKLAVEYVDKKDSVLAQQNEEIRLKSQISEGVQALERIKSFDRDQLKALALLEKTKSETDRFFQDRYKAVLANDEFQVMPSELEIFEHGRSTPTLTMRKRTAHKMPQSRLGMCSFGGSTDASSSESDSDSELGNS